MTNRINVLDREIEVLTDAAVAWEALGLDPSSTKLTGQQVALRDRAELFVQLVSARRLRNRTRSAPILEALDGEIDALIPASMAWHSLRLPLDATGLTAAQELLRSRAKLFVDLVAARTRIESDGHNRDAK